MVKLEVFSNDILFALFDDARTLGLVLQQMEQQTLFNEVIQSEGVEADKVEVGISTLSVLVS